jgi:4,5-DOPA dioxygenase extradiol
VKKLANGTKRMPIVFIGHGSPMNAIQSNDHTKTWALIGANIPKPKAILSISAHWYTHGTRIMDEENPKIIYDMHGFPDELYRVQYKPKGSPKLAELTRSLIKKQVVVDNSWGYDHGTWSVLCHMFPREDIPMCQLSVDKDASADVHFQIGKEISALRDNGVLIFASGNVVHNLSKIAWGMDGGYPWATEFDNYITENILKKDFEGVIHYKNAGKCADLAFYTPEHFYPLLYILGACSQTDKVSVFNNECTLGSLSMTSYLFEEIES